VLRDAIEKGVIKIIGSSVEIPVRNIQQCTGSLAHWNFEQIGT